VDYATESLKIFRGDTWDKNIVVTKTLDGSAYNLTGYTWYFTAKIAKSATTAVIAVSGLCDDDPATGIQPIGLTSEESAVAVRTYQYDVEVRNTDDPPIVKTIARGTLNIMQDITT